jgi:hypothetical protein
MQKGEGSRRLGTRRHAKRPGTWPGWAQAGRPRQAGPAQPRPICPPFDLAANRAIYSLGLESHASINSSSTVEEQRREGHHPGEDRVELVD